MARPAATSNRVAGTTRGLTGTAWTTQKVLARLDERSGRYDASECPTTRPSPAGVETPLDRSNKAFESRACSRPRRSLRRLGARTQTIGRAEFIEAGARFVTVGFGNGIRRNNFTSLRNAPAKSTALWLVGRFGPARNDCRDVVDCKGEFGARPSNSASRTRTLGSLDDAL